MSVDFEGQREGERVIFLFRRHILTAWKGMMFVFVMVMLGAVPVLLWPESGWAFWMGFGCMAVGMLGWGYAYMLWHFSVYVVTNERIRQIAQKGMFKKSVVDLGLEKIQSVSYEVPGVLGGIFGYGTLLVQTTVGDLVVSNVKKPEKVYNKLQNAMKEVEKSKT
ncbi:PH domain-containing protein [Candidatus Saccharibacteria bacterium]|nr:PH domain-containing protein [Candidatus Saccharibacteria bacterium]